MDKLKEEKLRKGLRKMFNRIAGMYKEITYISNQYKQELPLDEKSVEIMKEEIEASELPDDLKVILMLLLPTMATGVSPEGYIA